MNKYAASVARAYAITQPQFKSQKLRKDLETFETETEDGITSVTVSLRENLPSIVLFYEHYSGYHVNAQYENFGKVEGDCFFHAIFIDGENQTDICYQELVELGRKVKAPIMPEEHHAENAIQEAKMAGLITC